MDKLIVSGQHAYILEGDFASIQPSLRLCIEKTLNIKPEGNPDFLENWSEDGFGIDEARKLKEEISRKSFSGSKKVFVFGAPSFTRESQNALLKSFEEPTEDTYLFLVSANINQIIPTLLSRGRIIKTSKKLPTTINKEIEEFLKTSPNKRLQLSFVKKLVEEKERTRALNFLNALEEKIRKDRLPEEMTETECDFLSEIIKIRGYLSDRSPSIKMMFEHISLVAPVFKQ